MYYMIRGFDGEGRQNVAMPIFAASATLETVQANALSMLEDYGYKCATAKVTLMKTQPYRATITKPELIDAITNLIDEGIRKDRFGTYDEWQEAVKALLTEHEQK